MKNITNLTILLALILFQGCKEEAKSDSTSSDTGGDTITVPNQFSKSWIRGTGSTKNCETNYDTDGNGTSTATESQISFFNAGTSSEGSTIVYHWSAFYNTNTCYFDGPEEKIIDRLKLRIDSAINETSTTVTYRGTVTSTERMVKGANTLSAINAYDSGNGGCGKSDWISDANYQYSAFSSGCGVVSSPSEDAFDDFKFSNVSLGDVIYWKMTLNGSDMSLQASTDGGVTFDTATTYYAQ